MSSESSALALAGVVFSFLSLGVSGTTAYYTWLRRGRLAMTRPTLVSLGYEPGNRPTAKICLRTLLYSTAPQGKMIERMFVKLVRAGGEQVFASWGHGWTTELSPGSGLFVSQTGVSANHHFALSVRKPAYDFAAGDYALKVFAQEAGQSAPALLTELKLTVDPLQAKALAQRESQTIGRRHTDQRRAAHLHIGNGARGGQFNNRGGRFGGGGFEGRIDREQATPTDAKFLGEHGETLAMMQDESVRAGEHGRPDRKRGQHPRA